MLVVADFTLNCCDQHIHVVGDTTVLFGETDQMYVRVEVVLVLQNVQQLNFFVLKTLKNCWHSEEL